MPLQSLLFIERPKWNPTQISRFLKTWCLGRYGTKMEQSWNKVGKNYDLASLREGIRAFGCNFPQLPPKAPPDSRNCLPNARSLLHLCSKAPRATCSSEPHGVFIKSRGSISVAHMGPGPNLVRYFPCLSASSLQAAAGSSSDPSR